MASTITGISSMATGQVLAQLVTQYRAATGRIVSIKATGASMRPSAYERDEVFDLVILADDVIEKLAAERHLVAGSRVAFVRSSMAMAVRAGEPRPNIGGEEAVRAALMSARSISYSTGQAARISSRS